MRSRWRPFAPPVRSRPWRRRSCPRFRCCRTRTVGPSHESRQHHKHLKSTNMLERLNEEIKRRTHVVRIFPNGESCLRLVRALAVETHENWLEQDRYLNMDDLREHKKEALRRAD